MGETNLNPSQDDFQYEDRNMILIKTYYITYEGSYFKQQEN